MHRINTTVWLIFLVLMLFSVSCLDDMFLQQMKVETGAVSNINGVSASIEIQLIDHGETMSEYGVIYSSSNETKHGTIKKGKSAIKKGELYSIEIAKLEVSTKYYVAAYGGNGKDSVFGDIATFTTTNGIPEVLTIENFDVTDSSSIVKGEVIYDQGIEVTERGFYYGTENDLKNTGLKMLAGEGIGKFNDTITGLINGTTYYYASYAINLAGDSIGEIKEFTTVDIVIPEVQTDSAMNVSSSSAKLLGEIKNNGNGKITNCGFYVGLTPDVFTKGSKYSLSIKNNSVSLDINNLENGTTYYYAIFASNKEGEKIGEVKSFSTKTVTKPTVKTNEASNIGVASASLNGVVLSDGYATISEQGFYYGENSDPVNSGNKIIVNLARDTLSYNIKELEDSTNYYYTVFATNSIGTAFGELVSFVTDCPIPEQPEEIEGNTIVDANSKEEHYSILAINKSTSYEWTVPSDATIISGQGTTEIVVDFGESSGEIAVKAINNCGKSQSTLLEITVVLPPPRWQRDITTEVVDVTNPSTGKTWMDRNLGATKVAASSNDYKAYGDLYQWGRAADGHEKRISSLTSSISNKDTPTHGDFIISSVPNDWRKPQNNEFWQGEAGLNNPCPAGYRIPTLPEWESEWSSWTRSNITGAFESQLHLSAGGYRDPVNGNIINAGGTAFYWSSSVNGEYSYFMYAQNSSVNSSYNVRARAYSIRCIKDCEIPKTPLEIVGDNFFNSNMTSSYSVAAIENATVYNWSVPEDAVITSGQGTTEIIVQFGSAIGEITVKAINDCGESDEQVMMVSKNPEKDYTTTVMEVTNPVTGKVWMDRNLGASQAAFSAVDPYAYGDLFQWGRGGDGHEKRSSEITYTLSNSNTPGHSKFIVSGNSPSDWRSTKNDNLWQGESGFNNPCPMDYRLPTNAEWIAEYSSWTSKNNDGAFSSKLKLPAAGYRTYIDGTIKSNTYVGYYWSSTIGGDYSRSLLFTRDDAYSTNNNRANAMSVRCIKACETPNRPTNIIGNDSVERNTISETYSIEAINSATSYIWTVPSGAIIKSGQGSTEIVVDFGTMSGTISVKAKNDCGIGLVQNLSVYVEPWNRDNTKVIEVTNPTTGQIWMDRNLGALQAATSITDAKAFGKLFQWGRSADGHESRHSNSTTTLSSSGNPEHSKFIISTNLKYDWRNPQNDDSWHGVDGINNPCPTGFRVPTMVEWDAERKSWGSNNEQGALRSKLKLPRAGSRSSNDATINDGTGSIGAYWTSTDYGTMAKSFIFTSSNAALNNSYRAAGFSVRCIKY